MELTKLLAKPQLIKLTIDDEETIAEFGEAIDFYTLDRQPLDKFLKLSNAIGKDQDVVIACLKEMILDADGKRVMSTDDDLLPVKVMVRAMGLVMDTLGK